MNDSYQRHKQILIALFVGLIFVLNGSGTAVTHAADPILVACTDYVGDVAALIAAIDEANSDPDESTIRLGQNCGYTLTAPVAAGNLNGLPLVKYDLVLEGKDAYIERSLQAPDFRLLAVGNDVHLTINDLSLIGGLIPQEFGGAIVTGSGATLTLNHTYIEDNKALKGGAIFLGLDSSLTLNQVYFDDNSAAEEGGALYTAPGSNLTLDQVKLRDSDAKEGGAIYAQGEAVIRDSQLWQSDATGKGGGIYATAALTIERSDLYNNEARMGGGAIYAAGETAVYDSRFANNYADNSFGSGGAVLADGRLTVKRSHFAFNVAQNGGGILALNVQITDSDFYENHALYQGGGVYALDASRGIHGVHFDQNTADIYSGGGLFVRSNLDLQRSYFHRNVAKTVGGGLHLVGYGTAALIDNNLWVDNVSEAQTGNAMYLEMMNIGTVSARHNTVVSNGNPLPGSGIIHNNGNGVFDNNILTGFATALKDLSGAGVSRSNLYFNNTDNEEGLPAPGTNSLVADPKFVGAGNYRLGEDSPAIDSGLDLQILEDIRGNTRPQGNAPDRGAYEFNGEAETIFPVTCAGGAAELVAAITAANRHFGPDVIEIEAGSCVFELATAAGMFSDDDAAGLPAVMDTLRLDGGGAMVQRAESAAPFRILEAYAPRLTVENLTIRNGVAEYDGGGGLYSYYETKLHLNGVNLRDNYVNRHGGGVYAIGELIVENSQVTDNRAYDGGGLYADGEMTLHNSIVADNTALEYGGGASAYEASITNTLFTGNWAGYGGGGLAIWNMVELRTSTFIGNHAAGNSAAGDGGSALYFYRPVGSNLIENNVWLYNQTEDANAAVTSAAIKIYGGNPNSSVSLWHNTIVGGRLPESAAIEMGSDVDKVSYRVENNIIVGFAVGVRKENKGTLATNANLYFDNDLTEVGAGSSSNHVKSDPQFRNLAAGDARLRAGSPAIDSGANLGVLVDRKGTTRPQGNGYDIGAYEYTPNVPPTAAPDSYTTLQNTTLDIAAPGVLGNDEDADGDWLAAVLESQPAHGELTLNANGSFSYTPEAGYSGNDSFSYRADDYDGQSEAAKVTIEVLPPGSNLPPTAAPDAYTARQETPLTVPAPGVLDNDQDGNGDALTAVVESQPANGALTLNANGSFTYTPKAGYTGSDSFTYRANDGQASSAPATVTISILPTGANLPPLAFSDRYEGTQGTTLTIAAPGVLGNDQDEDGDTLAAVVENEPAHGTLVLNSDGSFSYSADNGFSGSDSFTYRASDGRAQSGPATVTIVVRPGGGQLQRLLLPVVFKP